jgi:hypothetical protein
MRPRLTALAKRVAELHDTNIRTGHCAEEFTLQRIRPLSSWEKLAYKCPQLADPSHKPSTGRILNFAFNH